MRVLLIGNGKLVYFLGKKFVEQKHQLTIINPNPSEAKDLAHQIQGTVIIGDGTHPKILKEAGAEKSDLVLALSSLDEDNLVICQIAKHHYGVPRTIAMVHDPAHQDFFEQMGISVVFCETQILADLIEKRADFAAIDNFFAIRGQKISITEIILDEDSPVIGKTLHSLELPEGVLIGGIIRQNQAFVPRGWSNLQVRDHLILISQPEHYKEFIEILTGKVE